MLLVGYIVEEREKIFLILCLYLQIKWSSLSLDSLEISGERVSRAVAVAECGVGTLL